jgi:hypothetical protein
VPPLLFARTLSLGLGDFAAGEFVVLLVFPVEEELANAFS